VFDVDVECWAKALSNDTTAYAGDDDITELSATMYITSTDGGTEYASKGYSTFGAGPGIADWHRFSFPLSELVGTNSFKVWITFLSQADEAAVSDVADALNPKGFAITELRMKRSIKLPGTAVNSLVVKDSTILKDTLTVASASTFSRTISVAGLGSFASNMAVEGSLEVNGGVVFNEDSADKDFRVESNGNIAMLYVDGATGGVGIGSSVPAEELDVVGDIGISGKSYFGAGAASNWGGHFSVYKTQAGDAIFRIENDSGTGYGGVISAGQDDGSHYILKLSDYADTQFQNIM
jgi:hypothetical protein